jgi:tRNA A-37 threonylcarbamoyl transferase component Bud32/tetratricopeptide (TPR) repeat protein
MHPEDSNYAETITESVPGSESTDATPSAERNVAPRLVCGDGDPLLGAVLDERFKLLEVLGAGGTSVVYKAHHITADRIVAVKVLHPHLAADEQSFARFRQETVAISTLEHPNIVKVFAFGITDDSKIVYAAMEFIDGRSLAQVLRDSGAMPIKRALNIFIQATGAIAFAHEKGILHRDLKTNNIMIVNEDDREERALIVDFGLAKIRRTDEFAQHLTQTGEVIGSPYSMSPEQCGNIEIDERSDIYSMGCVLYEAVTGRTVFTGETPLSILYKHTTEEPIPPARYSDEFTKYPQLQPVILKCLNKDPSQRFSTMAALHDKLVRIEDGTADADPDAARNAMFLAKRKKYFVTACGVALITPIIGLFLYCLMPEAVRAQCEFHWLNFKEFVVGNTSRRLMVERRELEEVLVRNRLYKEAIHLGNRNAAAGEARDPSKYSVERGEPIAQLAAIYAAAGEHATAKSLHDTAWDILQTIAKDATKNVYDRRRAITALLEMYTDSHRQNPTELGVLNTTLGDLYMSEHKYVNAIEQYNRGLCSQAEEKEHKNCFARRHLKMASALAGFGNLPDAGVSHSEAVKLTRSGHPMEDYESAASYYDLFAYKLFVDGHPSESSKYFALNTSLAKNTTNSFAPLRRNAMRHFFDARMLSKTDPAGSRREMALAKAAVAELSDVQQKELVRDYVGAAEVMGLKDDARELENLVQGSNMEFRMVPYN